MCIRIYLFIYLFIYSFIHSIICLTTVPQPLPKPVLHTVRSSASSSNFQYPHVSLTIFSSCLRLLPRLSVTYNLSYIFPSRTCFRKQFLRKTWPIQLPFLHFHAGNSFLHLSLRNKVKVSRDRPRWPKGFRVG